MPSIRIIDFAEVLIEYLAPIFSKDPNSIKIQITGKQQSEKLFEELVTLHEAERSLEFDDYYCILPTTNTDRLDRYDIKKSNPVSCEVSSQTNTHLTKPEVLNFLIKNKLI